MFGIKDVYSSENKLDLTLISRDFGSTAICIGFNKGSFAQPNDKIGVAHFAEHMILKESKGYPDIDKTHSELIGLGVTWNAYTSLFNTNVVLNVPDSADLYSVLDIFFDKVFNSSLSQKRLDLEKNAIIAELRSNKQNLSVYSAQLLINAMIGIDSTDWAFNGGKEQDIEQITTSDVREFVNTNYTKENLRIGIVGDIDIDPTREYIDSKLHMISSNDKKSIATDRKLDEALRLDLANTNTSSKLSFIQEAIPVSILTPSDAAKFLLLRSYLVGTGGAYLSRTLRSEKGLIYGVQSWSTYSSVQDYLRLSYEVTPEKYQEFILEKNKIYQDLSNGKIDEALFETTKKYREKVVKKWFESSDTLLEHWLSYKLANKPFGFDEIHEATKHVTKENFSEYTASVFQTKEIASVEVL